MQEEETREGEEEVREGEEIQVEVEPKEGEEPSGDKPDDEPPPEAASADNAWQPNFEFKSHGEVKQIPEWARAAITSEEAEKQLKEVFQRSDGLDPVKSERDEFAQSLAHYAPMIERARTAQHFLDQKDYGAFFKYTGVDERTILESASQILAARERAQSQGTPYMEGSWSGADQRIQQHNMQLYSQRQDNQIRQEALQAKQYELETYMSRPDVQQVAQEFDQRMGRSGAFREGVINHGVARHQGGSPNLPVYQVAEEFMRVAGLQLQPYGYQPQQAQAVGAPRTGHPEVVRPRQTPKTLPRISGTGTSPAKQASPRSIAELKKIRQAKEAGA